jgi:type I restriction enzyme, S subunit
VKNGTLEVSRVVQLGEVAEINPGSAARNALDYNDAVSFVSMSDVSDLTFKVESESEKNFESVSKGYTAFERGDVLLAKITPCFENGKLAIADIKNPFGFGSTEFHVIRPRKDQLDTRFIYHFLRRENFRIEGKKKMTGSAGQQRVPKHFLDGLEIPLPPLEQQRRIAAILDAVDALRAKRRESLQKLEALLKSVFLKMFGDPITNPKGWAEYRLEQVAEVVSGVAKGRKFEDQETVEVPYMRVANVQDGHISLKEVKTIEVLPSEIKKYKLEKGDILLTEGGDPDKLGRGAIWTAEIPNCIHQNHIFRVRVSPEIILPEFLNSFIGSSRGKNYFLKAAKQTTGIASINMTQLKNFPLLLPPINLQDEYKNQVRKFEGQLIEYESALLLLETLFSSLQHLAFNGELTPHALERELNAVEVQAALF